jgi:hypothetical protein
MKSKFIFIGIFLINILLFLPFTSISRTTKSNPIALKKGLVLIYQVDNQDQKYDFVVTVEKYDTALMFSFKMTNQRRTSGKITLTGKALNSAIAQYNYFQSNEVTLDNQTSIWVSKSVWKKVKKKKKCSISTNSGVMNLKELDFVNNQGYNLLLNGNDTIIDVIYCVTNDSNAFKYWILDDPKNPLILKMELNFTLELKEIKYLD